MSIALSPDAVTQLERWTSKARRLFDELLEDAPSALQREFIQRAVAAGHTAAEVHAFADAIRALDDERVFTSCTLESMPPNHSVPQLLRAEVDPLYAYELKGGTLEPADEGRPPARVELQLPPQKPAEPLVAPPKKVAFEADSRGVTVSPLPGRSSSALPQVGSSPTLPRVGSAASLPRVGSVPSLPPVSGSTTLLSDLLTEATRALGIHWREDDVDAPGGLTLASAIAAASSALERGLVVAAAIGPNPGKHKRFILFLQVSTAGRTRAFQLYEPVSRELCWVNEGDLLQGRELPFGNKANRRLTRIVLPGSLR